jgi:hypothetical protein
MDFNERIPNAETNGKFRIARVSQILKNDVANVLASRSKFNDDRENLHVNQTKTQFYQITNNSNAHVEHPGSKLVVRRRKLLALTRTEVEANAAHRRTGTFETNDRRVES